MESAFVLSLKEAKPLTGFATLRKHEQNLNKLGREITAKEKLATSENLDFLVDFPSVNKKLKEMCVNETTCRN